MSVRTAYCHNNNIDLKSEASSPIPTTAGIREDHFNEAAEASSTAENVSTEVLTLDAEAHDSFTKASGSFEDALQNGDPEMITKLMEDPAGPKLAKTDFGAAVELLEKKEVPKAAWRVGVVLRMLACAASCV
jgi:hypothetical protein